MSYLARKIPDKLSTEPLVTHSIPLGDVAQKGIRAWLISTVKENSTLIVAVSLLATLWYAAKFISVIQPYWFNPKWTTDDALQQVYPFYEAIYPGLFKGDLITEVMKGYLAPLHYWLCFGITKLTADPIMMSHWVMLIQFGLALGFLFAVVRVASSTAPALLSIFWLLHTRLVMQRLTGGLPRGWSAPVFTAFLYFALTGNHIGVLTVILLGCLLTPPATLVVATAYGFILVWRCFTTSEEQYRKMYFRRLLSYAAISPLYIAITLYVVHQPESIGQMVSFDVASTMPEFSRPLGRFPFIPFQSVWEEFRGFGLQAFIGRFYNPGAFLSATTPYFVAVGLLALAGIGVCRSRRVIPAEVVMFGLAALFVYGMSRVLAFKLYVPNRHLQIPMAIFFITAFTIGAWRAFHRSSLRKWEWHENVASESLRDSSMRVANVSALALLVIASFVFLTSNKGLTGTLNFNYSRDKHGRVFDWLKKYTPQDALVAGHPTLIDGTQLFAARRAFVTTETTHPFYTTYYSEMKRRTEVVLRAHYATSWQEFVSLLGKEGIDYFVFKRSDFTGSNLKTLTFFPPLDTLVKELISQPSDKYLFYSLPEQVDLAKVSYMPFRDDRSVVIDVKELERTL